MLQNWTDTLEQQRRQLNDVSYRSEVQKLCSTESWHYVRNCQRWRRFH